MYTVVTLSKADNTRVGYLGDFDSLTEAMGVVNEFNLKADRHPVIASIEEKKTNPQEESSEEESSEEESDFDLDSESSWDDDEYSEEIRLNTNPSGMDEDLTPRSEGINLRSSQPDNAPQRRLSPRRDTTPFMFANPSEDRYYGVIIDANGKILLREPANHYNNVRWEFYGGEPEEGETPTDTVIRETAEETGYTTRPVGKIGIFENNKNNLHFFLLKRLSKQRNWQNFGTKKEETWDTIFVSRSDAEHLLGLNEDPTYKNQLLEIMNQAYDLWGIKNRETE